MTSRDILRTSMPMALVALFFLSSVCSSATGAEPDVTRVAILPFAELTGSPERQGWGDAVGESLHSRLRNVKSFATSRPADIFPHLRALNKTVKDCVETDVALAVGKRSNADWIAYGSLDGRDRQIDVRFAVANVGTGERVLAYDGKVSEDDLLDLDVILAEKITSSAPGTKALAGNAQRKILFR